MGWPGPLEGPGAALDPDPDPKVVVIAVVETDTVLGVERVVFTGVGAPGAGVM